jgi:hypothetical protein
MISGGNMRLGLFFLLIVSLFSATNLFAQKQSPQSVILHNDGYKLFQEFRPNNAVFDRTMREMQELARKHNEKTFTESANLIRTLMGKCKLYYDTNTSLIEYFKKRWSQPHFINMTDEWKAATFKRDRDKVLALHSLSQGMQQAFNDWNKARNEAVKSSNSKGIIKKIAKANSMLKITIDAVMEEEKKVFESVHKELEIIKMSK